MNLCRICLSASTEKDLKESELKCNVDGTFKNYLEIFQFCLDIRLEDLDVNIKLCLSCFEKILQFYEFKCLALRSDHYFKGFLEPECYHDDGIKSKKLNEIKDLDVKEEVLDKEDAFQDYTSDDEIIVIKKEIEDNTVTDEVKKKEENKRQRGRPSNKIINDKNLKNGVQNKPDINKRKRGRPSNKIIIDKDLENEKDSVKNKPNGNKRKGGTCPSNKIIYKALENEKHGVQNKPNEKKPNRGRQSNKIKRENSVKNRKSGYQSKNKKCKECGKNVTYLKSHMRMHQPHPEGKKYECRTCGRSFLTRGDRFTHYKEHQSNTLCEICGGQYKYLTTHKNAVHFNLRPYVCKLCPKTFQDKARLKIHMTTSHTNERPYQCQECGKKFRCQDGLRHHRNRHDLTKQFTCTICLKTFKFRSNFYMHQIVHQEKKHECTKCGSKFARATHLRRHQEGVHRMQPAAVCAGRPPKPAPAAFSAVNTKDGES